MTTKSLTVHTVTCVVLMCGTVWAGAAYPYPNGWQLALIVGLSTGMVYTFCRVMWAAVKGAAQW